jgi:PAS domain S-box-containing protein
MGKKIKEQKEILTGKKADIQQNALLYYRTIVEIQDYAIILLNREGIIEHWNKGAEKIKGYKSEEIIGKSFKVFYSAADQDRKIPEMLINRAIEEGRADHEGWRIRKDGSTFWASVVITALHDDDDNIIGFAKITRDLTERKQAEDRLMVHSLELNQRNEMLRMSEERYHKMIEEVEDYAIILLTKEGIIEHWNKGAEKIKGYKPEEILGKNFRIFYSYEDQQKGLPELLINEARLKGKVEHEGYRVRKDGSRFWGSVVITSLHDDHNNIIGFLKVTRDLTERKKAEDELRENAMELEEKNEELEKMNQELSSFAYVSSHDLQEPLRKIQTFSTRILELDAHCLSDKGKDYFHRIETAASRMRLLIDDLLVYSRATFTERTFILTDLNKLISEIKDEFSEVIEEKKAILEIHSLPELPVIPFQIHQLISNILSNSLKFSKPGTVPHIIIKADVVEGKKIQSMGADPGKKYHHISVSDNGIGFQPEYKARIFEIFQRLHSKDQYMGTGIGLAICKKIVENHNGFISADGEENAGAVFHIYLPEF